MSVTTDRVCGFLSLVWERSNTSELPSINWKLRNPAIILKKWQANSYTTLMIKQMTSSSTFFVTKLDRGCVYGKHEWEWGSVSGCSNCETIAYGAECRPPRATSSSHSLRVWLQPLFSARSKETCCPNLQGSFNPAFKKITRLLSRWPGTGMHRLLSVQVGQDYKLDGVAWSSCAPESSTLGSAGRKKWLLQMLDWATCYWSWDS